MIEKIVNFVCKIGSDKYVHLIISLLLTFVVSYGIYLLSDYSLPQCAGMGAFATLCLGVAKECYDEFNGGELSYADLFFDIIGCIIGTIMTVW